MNAFEAEFRHTCPYTIIALLGQGYVSLMGIKSFTPLLMNYILKSTIEITSFKRTYRSMMTGSTDIDRFIIQLRILIAVEQWSETN